MSRRKRDQKKSSHVKGMIDKLKITSLSCLSTLSKKCTAC